MIVAERVGHSPDGASADWNLFETDLGLGPYEPTISSILSTVTPARLAAYRSKGSRSGESGGARDSNHSLECIYTEI